MSAPVLHGHATVWQRLTALVAADRLPHALLFTGPPGIGKALLARRLVAFLSCTAATDRPCGACAGCCQAIAGTHPDLLLISAPMPRKDSRKKDIGIDQARELKRFVQLQAVAAARKMAVIDDADRLSLAAQNALLKTLEEPPGRAVVVLVTASPGALLTTVRSRCQRVLLRPLNDSELRAALAEQGLTGDEIDGVVADAQGSPGRALALRDSGSADDRLALETLLADLEGGRYGSVLAMSKSFGKTEAETAARLDRVLALCQADARDALRSADHHRVLRASRRADAVAEALQNLRWRNPNRALLTEALALRLARI
jgi:DNA polymerase-3 subunit delta'